MEKGGLESLERAAIIRPALPILPVCVLEGGRVNHSFVFTRLGATEIDRW